MLCKGRGKHRCQILLKDSICERVLFLFSYMTIIWPYENYKGDRGDGCPVDAELTWSGSGRLSAMASQIQTGKTSGIWSMKVWNRGDLSPISHVLVSIGFMVATSKKLPHKNDVNKLWQTSHVLRAGSWVHFPVQSVQSVQSKNRCPNASNTKHIASHRF